MSDWGSDLEYDIEQQMGKENAEFVDSGAVTPEAVYEPSPLSDPYEMSLEEMRDWFVAHWDGPTNPYPQHWVELLDLDRYFETQMRLEKQWRLLGNF